MFCSYAGRLSGTQDAFGLMEMCICSVASVVFTQIAFSYGAGLTFGGSFPST